MLFVDVCVADFKIIKKGRAEKDNKYLSLLFIQNISTFLIGQNQSTKFP